MSNQGTSTVKVRHDKNERLWYVLSSDIPGLHAETETLDELVDAISDGTGFDCSESAENSCRHGSCPR